MTGKVLTKPPSAAELESGRVKVISGFVRLPSVYIA